MKIDWEPAPNAELEGEYSPQHLYPSVVSYVFEVRKSCFLTT